MRPRAAPGRFPLLSGSLLLDTTLDPPESSERRLHRMLDSLQRDLDLGGTPRRRRILQ